MNLRRLGLSDIQISPMGLGCWQFSKARGMASFFWPDLPDEEIQPIVKAALEGGINWFDTAEAYGKGQSEAALSRKAERNGVMQAAKELGITIIAYSPLAQGLLTGKFHDDTGLIKQRPGPRKWMSSYKRKGLQQSKPVVDELREVADEVGATPAQVALAWCMQRHGDTVVVIPGATKVKQAADNAQALRVALSDAQLGRLDEVSRRYM